MIDIFIMIDWLKFVVEIVEMVKIMKKIGSCQDIDKTLLIKTSKREHYCTVENIKADNIGGN